MYTTFGSILILNQTYTQKEEDKNQTNILHL
jgi:hypothetical protein